MRTTPRLPVKNVHRASTAGTFGLAVIAPFFATACQRIALDAKQLKVNAQIAMAPALNEDTSTHPSKS
jgi:hypothetical protein